MSYRIDSHEFKQSYYKMPNSSKMGFLITMRNKLLSGEVSVNKITWLDDLISFIENELKFLKEYPLPEIRFNSFDLVPFEPFNNLNTNTDNEEKITPTVLGQQKNKMSMKDHDKIVHEFKEMPYERQIAIIYARNFYSKIEEYPFYRFETNKELMKGMILKYKIEDIDVYNCLIEQLFTHYSQYIEILPLDNKDFREFYDEIQELYVEVLHYKKKSIPLVFEPKSKKESTTARAFFYFCLKEKGLFDIEETNRKSYLKEIGVLHGHGKDGESFYKIFNNLNIKSLENNTITETIEMLENYFKENENLKKNEVIEYAKSHIK